MLRLINIAWVEVYMLSNQKADTVYLNGNIYTLNKDRPEAAALAVKGQYLIYVGDNQGAQEFIGQDTKVVDLEGKTVLPGLIEGHMHYSRLGQRLLQLDTFWKPKEEILAAVQAEARRMPHGRWILGHGWNQEVWPGNEFPTKEELDAAAPHNPVALTRTCGHAVWVNSKALELAGINKDTPNPEGGEIFRDEQGNPTGILTDTATVLITGKIPPFGEEEQKQALLRAQSELFSYGITSAVDAGAGVSDIRLMKELYQSGDLKIRLYVMVNTGEDAEIYYQKGPETGLFGNRLAVNCVKFYADGSLGARSAWLLSEYSDRPGHFGSPRYTGDILYQLVKEARQYGFQVATHAIGDAAIRQCVDVYEKVLNELPLADHRYRIEHFQIAMREDIQRIAALGVIPAMQAVFATSDKNMAEKRLGTERIKGAYAWRKVIDAGSIIVNSSDAPVEAVNPYYGLHAAVTRTDLEGNPPGGWYPEEALTREEALKSFTIWAAYGQFEETIKGSLEAGKLADFVVIDRDYMTCPPEEIKDITALMTVVGGETVFTQTTG
ncbi:MAG: amidohydrolase [Peptococcaceae bacterium]|nr:amidohydrolase [Peptococcaceae bacterium]